MYCNTYFYSTCTGCSKIRVMVRTFNFLHVLSEYLKFSNRKAISYRYLAH